jgi:peptide/nickel transport system permease protein
MQAYVGRRLLWAIPTLLGALTVVFFLLYLLPGDVARLILGHEGTPDPEQLTALRAKLGLDRPIYEQYASWMGRFLRLDLGLSLWRGEPVAKELAMRLPVTLYLVLLAVLVSILLAIPVGVLSALRQDSWVDYGLRIFALVGLSTPSFVFGILLVLLLVVAFRWFPPLEYANLFTSPLVATQQLAVPALVLGYRQTAVAGRMLRSCLLEVLREDYIRTAHAKGLGLRHVVQRHALKNALLPVVTIFGIETVRLFSGAVVIEKVFNVPGLGSIVQRDYPAVQGSVLVLIAAVLVVNLLVDLFYAWLDPRIRYR